MRRGGDGRGREERGERGGAHVMPPVLVLSFLSE